MGTTLKRSRITELRSKIDPQLPGLHFELAEMLNSSSAGKEEAEGEYQTGLGGSIRLMNIPNAGSAISRFGKTIFRRLTAIHARAVELRPDDLEANLGLARVLMSMGQPEKAGPLLEHALQLDPTSAVAHYRLSTLYRQTGRAADAQHELEEYQKYKDLKEKLRDLYHTMRVEPAKEEPDDSGSVSINRPWSAGTHSCAASDFVRVTGPARFTELPPANSRSGRRSHELHRTLESRECADDENVSGSSCGLVSGCSACWDPPTTRPAWSDAKAVYLTRDHFPVNGDGIADDSRCLTTGHQ